MNIVTLNEHGLSAAAICRANGWEPGQHLVGDEGYGPTIIRITAIGAEQILAVQVSHNGRLSGRGWENSWVLWCRDWQPCEAPS